MSYRFDTDHITILQRQAGPEFAAIMAHIALHAPSELAFSMISLHEQTLGCHTYINQARTTEATIRGYRMLNQVLSAFAAAPVLPFDAAAAAIFEDLVARRVRIGRMDLRIASIALSRQMVVVTRNASDFGQVPALQIEDWTR